MGIQQETVSPAETLPLTPLGEACSRMDLTAIHEILEKVGYKDDEGVANEVSDLNLILYFRKRKKWQKSNPLLFYLNVIFILWLINLLFTNLFETITFYKHFFFCAYYCINHYNFYHPLFQYIFYLFKHESVGSPVIFNLNYVQQERLVLAKS